MTNQMVLKNYREAVDRDYVGFPPNGSSIKPVHVAGGVLRTIYGAYNATMNIKRMALVADSKGKIQPGNDTASIEELLVDNDALEEGISEGSLDSLRNAMQRLLSADKGVYVVKGLKDGMISYSAGSKYFLTKKAMYEDSGELMGEIICKYCPELAEYIKGLLEKGDDPITMLFEPLLEPDTMEEYECVRLENCPAFEKPNPALDWFLKGLNESGCCLKKNFEQALNPLMQLRLFNLFCIFQIMRYMTMLEAFYCNDTYRPIILDFSGKSPSQSSVARASEMSYTQMYKAVNRFYAWAYAQKLEEFSKEELLSMETPVYEENKEPSKSTQSELKILWEMAKSRAVQCENVDEIRAIYGETMYDMLAMVASSHPINYMKAMGAAAGILYPPDNTHPNKRYAVSQDILEMLLRCCVEPGEILNSTEIRERMWNRFGIIIGGSGYEMEKLQSCGAIFQVDEVALEGNFTAFSETLEAMDFAEVMADGILQIRLGGMANA